jgi:hypothetical protein
MEATIRELMGAGTPPRFKFKNTYASIEFPAGYTVPAQVTLEAKYNELLALEEDIQKTVIEGDLEVGTSNLFVDTETGRVGIGRTDPQVELDVSGVVNVSSNLEVGTSNLFVDTETSNVGIGTTNPTYKLDVTGDIYATGNVAAYSDKRAKSDIKKIENALDKIDQLNGYTFTMNDKRYAGVIAQEVLPILPEVVTGSEETNYAVAYGNMMGLVIEAIKEIKEKIG